MPSSQPKTCAGAQGSSNLDAAVHSAVFKLFDQVGYLEDTQRAYEALEMLITPAMVQDSERIELHRSDLGALVRTINRAMREDLQQTKSMAAQALELSR